MASDAIPLYDERAEAHLLGNLLLNARVFAPARAALLPDALFRPESRSLLAALDAAVSGGEIDFVTFDRALAADGRLADYVAAIQSSVMPVGLDTILSYVETINNQKQLRDLAAALDSARGQVGPEAKATELAATILDRLTNLSAGRTATAVLHPVSEVAPRVLERMRQWQTGEFSDGVVTGIRTIDRAISRLPSGEMTIIAARPSVGKSALSMQIAYNVARNPAYQHGQVAIFSLEMSAEDIVSRLVATDSGLHYGKLRKGKLNAEEWALAEASLSRIGRLPITIDPSPAPTVSDIMFRLSLLNSQRPVLLAIVDYVELVEGRGDSEELRVSGIARGLKRIAKTLHIPMLVISQLNRQVEGRANRLPQLSDLRASGMLESEANIVMLLHSKAYYERRGIDIDGNADQNEMTIVLAKNRNGAVGAINIYHDPATMRFADLYRGD